MKNHIIQSTEALAGRLHNGADQSGTTPGRSRRALSAIMALLALIVGVASSNSRAATACIEIRCPTNIVQYTCSNAVPVTYAVSATNRCNPSSLWTWCNPSSGTPFSLGETRVDCYAIGSGQTNQCSFTVTVRRADNCPPTNCIEIVCPTDIVRSTCSERTAVDYSVWATNRCKPSELWTGCIPPSGTSFPLGETNVMCWAIGSGQTNWCSFKVTVVRSPNCPPTNCIEIRCPLDIVKTTCSNSVPVMYSVWASNRCSPPNLWTGCNPPSGTSFDLGNTSVECWAIGSGQTNKCSFTVTVLRDPNCDDCSENLLVNGSFEDPGVPDGYAYLPLGDTTMPGWRVLLGGIEYYNPVVAPLAVNTGVAADGKYLLDLVPPNGGGGGVQQTFPTVVNRSYRVTFAMGTSKERGLNGTASLTVSVAGTAHAFNMATDSPSIVWERKSFSFVARAASTTIVFASMDDPWVSFVNLDDVVVSDCCEDSRLTITPTVTVEWDCGVLQSAFEVIGPWTDVSGATSPYTTALSGPHRFFRARLE